MSAADLNPVRSQLERLSADIEVTDLGGGMLAVDFRLFELDFIERGFNHSDEGAATLENYADVLSDNVASVFVQWPAGIQPLRAP